MKLANVKGIVAKGMILAVAAGALAIASPIKAEAQRFVVGVRVGDPYNAPRYDSYNAPRYDRYDRYEYARHEEFLRREAFFRHQEWERDHRFERPYGYR